ncbi:MAG: alpha/beta hydrolase fold domain-containing protein, partial [Actinomycetota bacterium]
AVLGVDPSRIGVYGDSAGGGLAAGTALIARDRGVPLARQILVYPMIDDRTEVDPALVPFLMWTYEDNETGWRALLGDTYRTEQVSPYAAPARATDLSGLAPAYIEVGELDAFRDENIAYAQRLAQASVSVELHVHPGVPHAFEALAPQVAVAQRSVADRLRALTSF